MILTRSDASKKAENTFSIRRLLAPVVGLLTLLSLTMGTKADAQRVHFRSNGGVWGYTRHAGWHRYWGGPSIGFYYAPTPVYVVPGYAAPSYYTGPDYWYSNPSFGLSINLGGGGYYGGGHYYHRHYHGGGYRVRDRR